METLKKYYWDKNIDICLTCQFIDEYAFNVADDGEVPFGYDGMALCCNKQDKKKSSIISPGWKACERYQKCSESQVNYETVYDQVTKTEIKNEFYVKQK